MTRKRRRNTPWIKTPGAPYHPLYGDQDNLRQDGTSPFCAMMQVAAEDTYDDYVICRGFDTRILKFIDYAAGDSDKPGISVAKPFGKRWSGLNKIGEIYPALLPTQGNADFTDFRQTTYTPPSPTAVEWRVGQNPGVVESGSGLESGQTDDLADTIEILYDHNGKVVNWLLIDAAGAGPQMYVTPGGGIPARSGATLGSATCTLLDLTGGTRSVTATTRTIYNDFLSSIAGSVDITASVIDGLWCIHAEDCS